MREYDPDADAYDEMWGPLPPHVIPYAERDLDRDQPWLTPEMRAYAETYEQGFRVSAITIAESLGPEIAELAGDIVGFCEQFNRPHIGVRQFILTPDYRIVEERNTFRWGMFCEHGDRIIDRTVICDAPENEYDRSGFGTPPSWKRQQGMKRHVSEFSYQAERIWVSTVFVGVSVDDLFETMIFGGLLHNVQWRHQRLDEGKLAHWDAVRIAQESWGYVRRHGRQIKKLYQQRDRIVRLARKRGESWYQQHQHYIGSIVNRLSQIPGSPNYLPSDTLIGMCLDFLPREPLRKGRARTATNPSDEESE